LKRDLTVPARKQSENSLKQRGFSRTIVANDRNQLTGVDMQADTI
jgi:hypothetical protein